MIITSSEEDTQKPFEIVQRKVFTPVESPEILVVERLALAKVAVPEMIVQRPTPVIGVFPWRVEMVEQID